MTARQFPFHVVPSVQDDSISQRVVFCDFDGPIVDVSERYYQTYRKGLLAIESLYERVSSSGERAVVQPLSKSEFWQMKQNRVADREIALRSGLSEDSFLAFMQQVDRIVNHPSLLQWDRLQPTAREALDYLKRCHIRLVLVTLRHPRQVRAFLKAQGLAPFVDEVYGVADVNAAYANRVEQKCDLLKMAIAQQQAQGYQTTGSWMVGDTEADVLAGQSSGLSTVALSCGVRSAAYLAKLEPSSIYGNLMEAACAVVNTVALQAA